MNNLINVGELKTQMTSLEIAEIADRNHKDVMRSIRDMEDAWIKVNGRKFALVEYKDAKGEMRPMYQLNKIECLYIATKFNDEARAKLVIRWEQLELSQKPKLPQTFAEALQLAANQAKELEQKEALLIEQAPKVTFANAVVGSRSSCLIGELAKIITQNGYEIGQNRLFEWLRTNHYIGSKGENYNIPNQKYIEQGLFELKKGVRSGNDGVLHTTITTKITGKGQVYFVNKFLSEK